MKYVWLIAFSLFNILSYGQSKMVSVNLGKEYASSKGLPLFYSSGNEKDGYVHLTLEDNNKLLNIAVFDPQTLALQSKKGIEIPERSNNFNSEMMIRSGETYYWIYSDWDKKTGTEILYYDKVDIHAGRISGQNKPILSTSRLAGNFWYSRIINKYKITQDLSRKITLVNYRLAPEEKNNKKSYAKFGFHVFDDQMKELWGQEFTMPYTEAMMDVAAVSVDAAANVYMLCKIYDTDKREERNKETGNPGYHYEVFKYSGDKKESVKTTIPVQDNFIKEESLKENANHDMVIAFTYNKNPENKEVEGVFIAKINTAGEIIKYKNGFHKFPKSYLTDNEQGDGKAKGRATFKPMNLAIRDMIFEKDGSIFIAAEVYGTDKLSFSPGGDPISPKVQVTTIYSNYYDNIITGKINRDGNFDWFNIIPRKQLCGYSENFIGFKVLNSNAGYYVLYSSNINTERVTVKGIDEYYAGQFAAQVFVSKITKSGEITKELVQDNPAADMLFLFPQFKIINNNQLIGRAMLKKDAFKPLILKIN